MTWAGGVVGDLGLRGLRLVRCACTVQYVSELDGGGAHGWTLVVQMRLGAHEYRVEMADDGPRPPRKHNHHSLDDYAYWTRAAS